MRTLLVIALCLFIGKTQRSHAQNSAQEVRGQVFTTATHGVEEAAQGATVYWLGSTIGTSTDNQGNFRLKMADGHSRMVVSFIGYKSDTLKINDPSLQIKSILIEDYTLETVEIEHRQKTVQIDFINPLNSSLISEKELLKAACCNLSESFETNPSVDVSFTDAVTGTRQIQMLGLAGPYSQITRENIPSVRGLSSISGMTYIPGTWIESIQLNKGAGSVVNGFESVAGQINVELRKPENTDKLFFNLYGNEGGRFEANLNFAQKVKDKWSTGVLLHTKTNAIANDRNEDTFLDNPLSKHFIGLNRWKYIGDNGLMFQAGIKTMIIDNTGGQEGWNKNNQTTVWGMKDDTKRLDGWMKIGKVYIDQPWKSVGFQLSGSWHDQNSTFGLSKYTGQQESIYGNLVYQTMLLNTAHKVKMGASIQYDDYVELLGNDSLQNDYSRMELVPGVFFEYTYTLREDFTLMTGVRVDHHNNYGLFATPRVHARYVFSDQTVLRGSIGRGQRTANIISENIGMLATSRRLIINGNHPQSPYGLDPEVAWNYGLSLSHEFTLDYRPGVISAEYFFTDFENQIVTDLDRTPREVSFSNLNGKSVSNSFQIQLDYEVLKRVDLRLGYRWFDVTTTYFTGLMQKPLVSKHRTFLNLAYESRSDWKFDYTVNRQGKKRLPKTSSNPEQYIRDDYSPAFYVMNMQITKAWKKLEVYVGMENILNYRQQNPILSSENPFGAYFDSAMIWGPIFGRNTYAGLRYRI